jgi:hypothetical protein
MSAKRARCEVSPQGRYVAHLDTPEVVDTPPKDESKSLTGSVCRSEVYFAASGSQGTTDYGCEKAGRRIENELLLLLQIHSC